MNIQKLENHNFDTSKTVLLCCKGPSSIEAPHHAEGKYVAVTTSACQIFNHCDFLFANDVEFFQTAKIDHVDRLIVPIVMHATEGGVAGVHDHLPVETHLFHHVLKDFNQNVYTYKLHTQDLSPKYSNMDISPLGDTLSFHTEGWLHAVLSGYHTALHWLIAAGFRNFDIFGVSECGSYNMETVNTSVPKNTRPDDWFEINYKLGLDILNESSCNFRIR